ncbi:MAG: hypothetical protein WCE35_01110 [Bradyrhizobium sp.]
MLRLRTRSSSTTFHRKSTDLASKLILLHGLIAACSPIQKMKTAWMATPIPIATIATTAAVHADDYSHAIKTHRDRVEKHAMPSGAAAAAHACELHMPRLSW